jgi:hypothetical protein
MLVQGAFNLLFRPGLRDNFLDSYENYESEYPVYLKQDTMDTPEQSASIIAGLSRLYERADGEPITYDTPKMGPKVMGVDKEFALGFMLTRKTVEDDQYGKANQSAKWLGHAANMTKEYRSAALLDDAFAGATFKGIDNLSLCNTAHTLLNSNKTVSNALATPVGVSVTGITAMFDLAQVMKDENGDPIKVFPDTLLIGNSAGDLQRAMQIFGSDKEPFTAENQDNAIKKRLSAPKIQISRFKASTKPWFMIDSKWNDAHFVTRRPVEFDDDFDFNTDAALYKVTTRFLIWFVDWRGWLGSNAT